MDLIIYFIVAIFSTTVGAITGLGGGILIKPILSLTTNISLGDINFLSTITVFSMALFVTVRSQLEKKNPFTKDTINLAIGSIIGGLIGSKIFFYLIANMSHTVVQDIQSILIIIMILGILYIRRIDLQYPLKRTKTNLIISGLIMGVIASFLGIGGGPINMAVLMICFGFDIKDSAMKSSVTILFSQLMNLFTIYQKTGFAVYDFHIASLMIIGAIMGGYIGSYILHLVPHNKVTLIFNFAFIIVIILNLMIIFNVGA